jgi:hypothetical protein
MGALSRQPAENENGDRGEGVVGWSLFLSRPTGSPGSCYPLNRERTVGCELKNTLGRAVWAPERRPMKPNPTQLRAFTGPTSARLTAASPRSSPTPSSQRCHPRRSGSPRHAVTAAYATSSLSSPSSSSPRCRSPPLRTGPPRSAPLYISLTAACAPLQRRIEDS